MLFKRTHTIRGRAAHSRRHRRRGKGQALVEFAVLGLLLAMLLAGAIDFGRAYYTAVVVTQMAGEGVAYAAWYPDRDEDYPTAGACSRIVVDQATTIQDRARLVARERGLVIQPSQATIAIQHEDGTAFPCSTRCAGATIRVRVSYQINDLFLPGMLGMNNITINRTSTQRLMRAAYAAEGTCD